MFVTPGSRGNRKRIGASGGLSLPIVGDGLTYTVSTPLLDLSQTWNAGAVTFTALKLNVTNTASAAASKLLDLQVGGATKFNVTNLGVAFISDTTPSRLVYTFNSSQLGMGNSGTTAGCGILSHGGNAYVDWGSSRLIIGGSGFPTIFASTLCTLNWPSSGPALAMDAAAILAQRNGTAAQTFRVYNTYTDASNYERGVFDWSTTANTLTIGTQAAGTGTSRNLTLVAAGGTATLQMGATNNVFTMPAASILALTIGGTAACDFDANNGIKVYTSGYKWATGPGTAPNTALVRVANGVVGFSANTALDGWYQWTGERRVTSDFTSSNATLTAITGISSVALQAGRNYSFDAWLAVTGSSLAGVQIGITCSSSTITTLISDGFMLDAGVIRGSSVGVINSTGTPVIAVSSATVTSSNPSARISGMIRVASTGTFGLTLAQSTANGTQTIVSSASWMMVYDMP